MTSGASLGLGVVCESQDTDWTRFHLRPPDLGVPSAVAQALREPIGPRTILKPRMPSQRADLAVETLTWSKMDFSKPRPRWAVISANNSRILIGFREGPFQICRPDGTVVSNLEGAVTNVLCGDFSIDDRFLVLGFADFSLRRYEVESGRLVKSLRSSLLNSGDAMGLVLEINQDASKVVLKNQSVTSRTGTEIWDFEQGKIIAKWGLRNLISARSFARGGTNRLDQSLDWRLRAAQTRPETSPDGRYRATWNTNGLVQIWSVTSAERMTVPLKHGGSINAMRFKQDGTKLVTACEDRMARIWDLSPDMSPTDELQRQADFLSGKTLSPAGLMEPLSKERNEELSAHFFASVSNWAGSAPTNVVPDWLAQVIARRPSAPSGSIPARSTATSPRLLDLTAHYNASLSGAWHAGAADRSDLSEVPHGEVELAGTRFDVRGLIQVGWMDRSQVEYPSAVADIVISNRCQRLHFLHSAINAFSIKDEREIGHYLVHYADGSSANIPIFTRKDVADWFEQEGEQDAPLKVAWRGESEHSRQVGRKIRLFKSTWENPKPDVVIQTIDFVSTARVVAPFLVAVTRE